ncbi:6078_t:CDS:1, partial [Ambispora leptoticha]
DMATQIWCKKIREDDQFDVPKKLDSENIPTSSDKKEKKPEDKEPANHTAVFDLLVPYLPRTKDNPASRRVFISFDDVNRYVKEFTEKISEVENENEMKPIHYLGINPPPLLAL